MPVIAEKPLTSGNRVRIRVEVISGIARFQIAYKRTPSAEDRAEAETAVRTANRMMGYQELPDDHPANGQDPPPAATD